MKITPYQKLLLPALALVAVVLRWMEHSRLIYGWDSVHYLLAQDHYDLLAHQPHPPGSYYYVLIARALRLVTGDAHTALLLLSALFGGGLVVVLFHLGRALGEEDGAGWLAAAVGATAPLFWFYGSVALNYGPSGTLTTLVALGCVLACRSSGEANEGTSRGVLLAGAVLGLLGGFRPTDVVFLTPAYLWALYCAGRAGLPLRSLALGPLALGLFTIGWLLPTLVNTGGLGGYLASIRGQEHLLARSSALLAGDPALKDAIYTHKRSLQSLVGVEWLTLLAPIGLLFGRAPGSKLPGTSGRMGVLGVLIVLPAFAFYLYGHFNSPGYALTYGGFVVAAVAAGCYALLRRVIVSARRRQVATAGLATVILVANGVLFLRGWPGAGMKGQRSLSAVEIRDHDGYYRDLTTFLRAHHAPGEIRLLSSWNSTDGLRIVQSLLPEYAADVAQAVGEVPHLPSSFDNLTWLRLMTPDQIRREGRPVYLISRTHEDPDYHASLFHGKWEEVAIGPRHRLYRLFPSGGVME